MKRVNRVALGLGILAIAVAGSVLLYQWAAPETPHRSDFALADLDGTMRAVGDYDGQVIVLNFWATWCAPCRKEIPMLVAAQKQWGHRGLQVIGIAIDDHAPSAEFAERYGINYPVLAAPTEGARIQDRYTRPGTPAGVLPYTAIIDRSGQVVAQIAGALTRDQLTARIEPLLAEPAPTD